MSQFQLLRYCPKFFVTTSLHCWLDCVYLNDDSLEIAKDFAFTDPEDFV
jgi:hypothetical protein